MNAWLSAGRFRHSLAISLSLWVQNMQNVELSVLVSFEHTTSTCHPHKQTKSTPIACLCWFLRSVTIPFVSQSLGILYFVFFFHFHLCFIHVIFWEFVLKIATQPNSRLQNNLQGCCICCYVPRLSSVGFWTLFAMKLTTYLFGLEIPFWETR